MNISELKAGGEEERDPTGLTTCHTNLSNVSKGNITFSSSTSTRIEPDSTNPSTIASIRRFDGHGALQILSNRVRPIPPFSNIITLQSDFAGPARLPVSEQYERSTCLSPISAINFPRQLPSIPGGQENERLSITIPHVTPDISEVISPSPSLLMTSSSQCLTPSSPASVIPSVSPLKHDAEISSEVVNKVLFVNDDASEEEKIDVCTIKESHPIATYNKSINKNNKDSLRQADQDGIEATKKDSTSHFYSYLGSQCSRTVPSLMKFYSRHKRSLSTSLSVTLAVSGQATPPCSPISPGTMSVVPSWQKRSLEASTMTSPTDQSFHASSECLSSLIQNNQQQQQQQQAPSCTTSSSLTALTLLNIANLSAEEFVPNAKLSPSQTENENKLDEEKQSNATGTNEPGERP